MEFRSAPVAEQEDPLQKRTDEELMSKVSASHDHAAFEALEHRYDQRLHGYLLNRLRDPNASDDVYQMIWMNVYTRSASYEKGHPFQAWLFTIGKNALIDWKRRNSRHDACSLDTTYVICNDERTALMNLMVDDLAAPDDMAMMHEEHERIHTCIEHLPDHLRETVLLVRYKGLSNAEAGEVLGIPKKTVGSRYRTAIQRLALELGVDLAQQEDNDQ